MKILFCFSLKARLYLEEYLFKHPSSVCITAKGLFLCIVVLSVEDGAQSLVCAKQELYH